MQAAHTLFCFLCVSVALRETVSPPPEPRSLAAVYHGTHGNSAMIEIDGSEGEGGGQILLSALALSILTGKPFKLINIRARRTKPGLAPQHLASVRAAANISSAQYKGGQIGSAVLNFEPGTCKAGKYALGVHTAGATALILHTVYLPLALRGGGDSTLTITGKKTIKIATKIFG